jgi:DNA-binding XRE family transcriptional regulator
MVSTEERVEMAETVEAVELADASMVGETAKGRKVTLLDIEITRLLKAARLEKKLTVTECAGLVGTTRRRYGAIEKGEATLGAAELLMLMRFLGVSPGRIWEIADGTQNTVAKDADSGTVVVRILPGQTVTLMVGDTP